MQWQSEKRKAKLGFIVNMVHDNKPRTKTIKSKKSILLATNGNKASNIQVWLYFELYKYNKTIKLFTIVYNCLGTPCPQGMISMVGGCYGIVKNTFPDPIDDANCNWKSGNTNFQQVKLQNIVETKNCSTCKLSYS